jgi:chaperone BCS1
MFFRLNKSDKAAGPAARYGETRTLDDPFLGQTMTLSCLGFTDTPLSAFLKRVQLEKPRTMHTTNLYTVSFGGGGYSMEWGGKERLTRPLSIDLDEAIKTDLIGDIEKFLSPSRQQWYGNRGIPYLRGYLFAGSPGTGKSSISLAIAGLTGGNLFMISMNEVQDEAHLKRLFVDPEKRDILLLEDIDSAGIGREKMVEEKKPKKKGISLSGLLNTIDTARKDGVILIMTTNDPGSFDPALVRPGRMDKTVVFSLVDQAVTKNTFRRIYQSDDVDSADNRVLELAEQFVATIPPLKFTPAEIQGFLNPIDEPEEALKQTDTWVSGLLDAKAKGKKIVGDITEDSTLQLTENDSSLQPAEGDCTPHPEEDDPTLQPSPGLEEDEEADDSEDDEYFPEPTYIMNGLDETVFGDIWHYSSNRG